MPTAQPQRHAARRRHIAYTSKFHSLNPEQRQEELANLKELYEKDGLSIRRIAEKKSSTYGFIRARLLDAGVDISVNRKGQAQTRTH
jgi:hypothetical protein